MQVLQALQINPILSLHEIHLATDISKPSLLRILHTLEQSGMVSRRLADGHYRISTVAAHGRKRDRYDRVAEAAAPVLDRLCQKVSWPSDLFVPAGDHMERRESSRSQTPYFIHPSLPDARRSTSELADDRSGARLSSVLSGAGAGGNYPNAPQVGSA